MQEYTGVLGGTWGDKLGIANLLAQAAVHGVCSGEQISYVD